MFGRGWWLVPVVLVTLLIGGGIGAVVSHRHHDHERTVQVTTGTNPQNGEPAQVITIDRDGRWGRGWGFFPFGFLLFPLIWIALIWLIFGGLSRRGRWGRWGERMDDWHRRQHESTNQGPGPSGPASA